MKKKQTKVMMDHTFSKDIESLEQLNMSLYYFTLKAMDNDALFTAFTILMSLKNSMREVEEEGNPRAVYNQAETNEFINTRTRIILEEMTIRNIQFQNWITLWLYEGKKQKFYTPLKPGAMEPGTNE